MFRKKIRKIGICMMLALTTCLVACGGKGTDGSDSKHPQGDIEVIKNMKDLSRGSYYVEVEGGYASPYWGDTSFVQTQDYERADNKKVAWFTDKDWSKIPTLYGGSCIVFRSNTQFEEEFFFERYYDLGYTVGLCNLEKTTTDRYRFSTAPDSSQINQGSEARELTELGKNSVIIDTIGGNFVRGSKISPCGTIMGLTHNEKYDADIYIGTELEKHTLIADSRALFSVQVNEVNDYSFMEAEIIRVEIPDYFNDGYYSVNGSGIFRYIKEGTYKEGKTNMNKENALSEDDVSANQQTDVYENVEITKAGKYHLQVVFDDVVNKDLTNNLGTANREIPLPMCYLTVNDSPVLFNNVDEHTRELEVELEPGMYPLDLRYTYGRGYTINLSYLDEEPVPAEPETETVEGDNGF